MTGQSPPRGPEFRAWRLNCAVYPAMSVRTETAGLQIKDLASERDPARGLPGKNAGAALPGRAGFAESGGGAP